MRPGSPPPGLAAVAPSAYLVPMAIHQHAFDTENNPDLLCVDIVDGKLWLSDDVRCDIEGFAGSCLQTDSPRRMIDFLQARCAELRQVDFDDGRADNHFMAFCVLKGIEHAIETRLYGSDVVGDFCPEQLIAAFTSSAQTPPLSYTLH
jgi:hypothetical protein